MADRTTGWDVGSVAVSGTALVGTVVALRLGASPHRWGPVVGFVALWAGGASYAMLAKVGMRRRSLRLQGFSAPDGGRLSKPIWILILDFIELTGFGAAVGAVAAGTGFPSVGVGMLLAIAGTGAVSLLPFAREPVGLTFESSGLRVHVRNDFQFFVPWTSIVDVTLTGRSVNLRIVDPGRTVASASPDNPRNRERVRTLLWLEDPHGEAFSLSPWTGGLDSLTLSRVLREASDRRSRATN